MSSVISGLISCITGSIAPLTVSSSTRTNEEESEIGSDRHAFWLYDRDSNEMEMAETCFNKDGAEFSPKLFNCEFSLNESRLNVSVLFFRAKDASDFKPPAQCWLRIHLNISGELRGHKWILTLPNAPDKPPPESYAKFFVARLKNAWQDIKEEQQAVDILNALCAKEFEWKDLSNDLQVSHPPS